MDMNAVLMTIALFSLAATAAFGVIAWQARAEARRRSAARVAALAAAAGTPPDLAGHTEPVAVSSLFHSAPGAMLTGRPAITIAVVATLAAGLAGVAALSGPDDAADGRPATASGASLELISMRHTFEGETLTVTGLVRNPRSGEAVTRVAAVVFAFDRAGSFAASSRAPLDFTRLEPGDESPFVVSVGDVADIGRYRVSFRTEAGMLRHVDRRAEQMARRPD
jgi:hypothetical protein